MMIPLIKVIIKDGLHSYSEAYRKELWEINRQTRPIHIKHIHLRGDMNNNKMERMNGEFRDREKVARGLKKEDSPLINGYQIFRNCTLVGTQIDLLSLSMSGH